MFRRRPTRTVTNSISIESGCIDDDNNHGKVYHKKRRRRRSTSSLTLSFQSILIIYLIIWFILLARSYLDGITAAGNETWYPVPLMGFVRSELALVCFVVGSIPFLLMVLGWTYVGLLLLLGLAIWIPNLVMPGPMPIPEESYHCYGIIFMLLAMIMVPFWKKHQAAIAMFIAISIIMPNLPEYIKPLFSAIPVEYIPEQVINFRPDIIEDTGAAALETGPLLDFVWSNRNDWVKVSHGRALGYFVFG